MWSLQRLTFPYCHVFRSRTCDSSFPSAYIKNLFTASTRHMMVDGVDSRTQLLVRASSSSPRHDFFQAESCPSIDCQRGGVGNGNNINNVIC